MSVVVFHLFGALTPFPFWGRPTDDVFGPLVFRITAYGWVGVPLFFMISGFVISMSSWGRTPAQFAVSRFVRLFPAYWAGVALTTTAYVFIRGDNPAPHWRDVVANLTMLNAPLGVPYVDDVYWTLWAELRFYILFAIVIWRGLTFRSAVTFCLIWTIAAAWASQSGSALLQSITIYDQAHYFIAGIALFLMHRFGRHPVLWLLLGISCAMSIHYPGNPFPASVGLSNLPSTLAILAGYGVLTLLALGKLDWVRWRGLTTVGALTYPLYLLHCGIGVLTLEYLYPRVNLQPWALVTIVIVGFVILAWLVNRLVERPLAPRLKRAFNRSITPRPEGVPVNGATATQPPVIPHQAGPDGFQRPSGHVETTTAPTDLGPAGAAAVRS
jgi:peptidoglycan/LPS O-acetylase OafA/YrhL